METRKKVLFVISTLRMGGAEKSIVTLLKLLDKEKIDVDLYLFESGGILESEVPKWVNIISADPVTRGMTLEFRKYIVGVLKKGKIIAAFNRFKMSIDAKKNKNGMFNWNRIKKYIPMNTKKYDVAISYLEDFSSFYVIDKVISDKKIGWIHTDFSKRKALSEEIEYFEKFDQLVTISDICKEAFIRTSPKIKERICVLENIVNPEEVKKKAMMDISDSWTDGEKYQIVSVGRLERIKGFDIAAEAAKILKERNISFCWHVYGKGNMKDELEEYIQKNELGSFFILEGIRENPYPYVKKADIIVQPSRTEGKSIVLDEAKILGKAIVVTNYPSVFDQIKDRETGVITEINAESVADGIELVINDARLKKRLEVNAENEENNSCKVVEKFYQLLV